MNPEDLKRRTKQFALRILKLVAALPNTVQGRTIGGSTSSRRNRGRSKLPSNMSQSIKAEFVSRMGVVEEEADESAYWLGLVVEGELLKEEQVEPLLNEANELAKIMASSRISASTALAPSSKIQSPIGNRKSAMNHG